MKKSTCLSFGRIEWSSTQKAWIVSIYPLAFPTLFDLCHQYQTCQRRERVPDSPFFEYLGRYLFEVLPVYYFPSLRSTLLKLGLTGLVPNKMPSPFPPFSIETELKALRRVAMDKLESIQVSVSNRLQEGPWKKRVWMKATMLTLEDIMQTPSTALPMLFRSMSSFLESCFRTDPESALEAFTKHSVSIQAMGQYQERMNSVIPFRSPFDDEAELKRQEKSLFGNPFKRVPKVTKWMKQAQRDRELVAASPTDEADKLYEAQARMESALSEAFVESVDIDMIHQDEPDEAMDMPLSCSESTSLQDSERDASYTEPSLPPVASPDPMAVIHAKEARSDPTVC